MKVWITTYALTKGIFTREIEDNFNFDAIPNSIVIDRGAGYEFFYKPNWHLSKAHAKSRAESMRAKKIASLKKQIAKLEAMKF